MKDLDLQGQKTMLRLDLNVPMENGQITSDARIKAAIPTILAAQEHGGKVIILSHLGRPDPGALKAIDSLQPVAEKLAQLTGQQVYFEPNWIESIPDIDNGIILCENVRFHEGETSNSEALSKQIASLCDVYVMDAFGAAHRKHATTYGVITFVQTACAGPLLTSEIESLSKAMQEPERPLVAIIGGAKVSSKLGVIEALTDICDHIIVGGGIANTFLAATGIETGNSLVEKDMIAVARNILESNKVNVPLPRDVMVAKELSQESEAVRKSVVDIEKDDQVLDIGPKTAQAYKSIIDSARTIIWNGPLGVFEIDQFSRGTQALALAVAENNSYTLVGGGDTVAVLEKYGIKDSVDYVSSGGGAFLEFIKSGTLLSLEAISRHAKS
jgi:phosphoglycerate kinase